MEIGRSDKRTKPFDIFISYKSENLTWVERLKRDLERRGVKVWLDKEQIRPGDFFAEALENGIQMSKSMGLIVTPESLRSNWVREEYYRALTLVNEDSLQLIPIILEKAELPGFLKGRQFVDFSDDDYYEKNVDRLVWPGITGKRIVITWVLPGEVDERYNKSTCHSHQHYRYEHNSLLYKLVKEIGVEVAQVSLNLESSQWYRLANRRSWHSPARHIIFINPLEDDLDPHLHCYPPKKYIDFIFKLRELTRNTEDEVAFVLQHKRSGLESSKGINAKTLKRLKHYFVIYNDEPEDVAIQSLQSLWLEAQRLLLNSETWNPPIPTVAPSRISVYGVYAGTKYIRKMRMTFAANCFVKEADTKFYIEGSALIVQFTGKSIRLNSSQDDDNFLRLKSDKDKLILVPTGLNGVWFDSSSSIKADLTYKKDLGEHAIDVRLEFLSSLQ